YDSDHPLSQGEVGKVGVAVDSFKDMEILFQGIPLDKVSTSMTINAPASILLSMYLVLAEKQKVPYEKLRGTLQNDLLKEYIARGTYIFPPRPSLRLTTDIFEYCSKYVPRINTISISGYHMREAGATAVQEVAFTLADAIEYVKAACKRGLELDEFAPRLSFFFASHNNFFEEIAKFRAARRLWARIIKSMGAKNPKSMMLRFHTQTSGCTLTAQQPENNIVRVTLQALAAVLGGTQSLHTNSMDEALALPSKKAVEVALRTQQVIAYESGVTMTADPLGGSYFLERLTLEIEKEVERYLDKIEGMGGMLSAIEKGYVQREISESAYLYQKSIETKDKILVGVNKFKTKERTKIPLLRIDKSVERKQVKSLKRLKKERDSFKVNDSLNKLERAAKSRENLVPYILGCVRVYATIGEICDTLRGVFGEYRVEGRL
ncbi:MAG: methylmalonyl-CoA mutase, partial [Candidatus Methanofastidiosia archaeon]